LLRNTAEVALSQKYDASEIEAKLRRGENIMSWIRDAEGSDRNSAAAITYAYDAQAGSYTAALENPATRELKNRIGARLAPLLDSIAPYSLMEAGVGEATSLAPVVGAMRNKPQHVLGLDLSLSRLLYARENLMARIVDSPDLFVAELGRIPLADASVDVVLTVHAVEPNYGREEAIVEELLRVAARRLVMIEPSYELGGAATRARIERFGYVRNLPGVLRRLGFETYSIEPWGLDASPENEAAIIVVEKAEERPSTKPLFVSPISGKPLVRRPDCWYCKEDGHAFPIVSGIACLTAQSGIIASKLEQFSPDVLSI
jgi:hypothetical protein